MNKNERRAAQRHQSFSEPSAGSLQIRVDVVQASHKVADERVLIFGSPRMLLCTAASLSLGPSLGNPGR